MSLSPLSFAIRTLRVHGAAERAYLSNSDVLLAREAHRL